jgi:hypothetical protein
MKTSTRKKNSHIARYERMATEGEAAVRVDDAIRAAREAANLLVLAVRGQDSHSISCHGMALRLNSGCVFCEKANALVRALGLNVGAR